MVATVSGALEASFSPELASIQRNVLYIELTDFRQDVRAQEPICLQYNDVIFRLEFLHDLSVIQCHHINGEMRNGPFWYLSCSFLCQRVTCWTLIYGRYFLSQLQSLHIRVICMYTGMNTYILISWYHAASFWFPVGTPFSTGKWLVVRFVSFRLWAEPLMLKLRKSIDFSRSREWVSSKGFDQKNCRLHYTGTTFL